MEFIIAFIFINLFAIVLIPFFKVTTKGIITVLVIAINAVISSLLAFPALQGHMSQFILPGSTVTGDIRLTIDALSAWFILIINFTMLTGAVYGLSYMKAYREQRVNISLHSVSFILVHASLLAICVINNSIAFLIAWEIMALSSFILIIFEHNKQQTIRAGLNFFVQSHISVLLLTFAFLCIAFSMDSYDFSAIGKFSLLASAPSLFALFIIFFTGFAIKAGFVPFHTWLPYAHPSAPSHVSGVMSGVIIKIGIYGILRILLLVKADYLQIGYFILIISVISGLYGVMLAIIQHNLKKLLAYHSIENIGIIGIGIGLGCIGLGTANDALATLGFAGALLHTLNHSLFKSLLFFGAGNIYQAAHTMNMEKLGGIIKKMPLNAGLFLIAALAICGLPPFNGFVSEFLIYSGLFKGIISASSGLLFALVFALTGLVLIGGLAILCFTKAFGIVFLGESRDVACNVSKENNTNLFPMYAIALLILSIGLIPGFFLNVLSEPVGLYLKLSTSHSTFNIQNSTFSIIQSIGLSSLAFILLATLLFFVRKLIISRNILQTSNSELQTPNSELPTWGCGYVAPNTRMQYTATSYIRTYRQLAEPLLLIFKKKKEIKGIFPIEGGHETHPYDKIELWFIDKPLLQLRNFFNRFTFLQNGKLQFYIIYGVVFILLILITPVIYDKIIMLFK